ncbi:MAG: SMP-30/gluconolactonase/LRE family protein [Candidatus Dormibacteria bacterium]
MPPTSLAPVRWTPPKPPHRGRAGDGPIPFPPARRIPVGGRGPEDVVAGRDGELYTGVDDGRILRVDPGSGEVRTVGTTGGRTLGLEVARDGSLICCDRRGLLRLDPRSGTVTTLVGEVDGSPLIFCSNAAEGPDGSIYFTESSHRFDLTQYRADLLEHGGSGRLFVRRPDGSVTTLLGGLDFANGVALTRDGTALLLAETGSYRLSRYQLSGSRAGSLDVVIDNLGGFPDNISVDSDGLCWVAMAAPRNHLLDLLGPRAPWMRRVVWRIPSRLQPQASRTAWVMAVDEQGRIVHDLRSSACGYHFVTGAVRAGDHVFLASLEEDALLEVRLPTAG